MDGRFRRRDEDRCDFVDFERFNVRKRVEEVLGGIEKIRQEFLAHGARQTPEGEGALELIEGEVIASFA